MSGHHRPRGFQRIDRVADQIQRELASLVQFGMKDPRLGMITIQHVKLSRDMAWADVYFTVLAKGRDEGRESEAVLANAAGWLRSQLAQEMKLRTVPKLRFHYDEIPEQADHVSRLIREARERDGAWSGSRDHDSGEDARGATDGKQPPGEGPDEPDQH